jgi:hypothetical protein
MMDNITGKYACNFCRVRKVGLFTWSVPPLPQRNSSLLTLIRSSATGPNRLVSHVGAINNLVFMSQEHQIQGVPVLHS